MKTQLIFTIIVVLFLIGCFWRPKKKDTIELKCHLYVEDFEVNPYGVNECYLTDSQNFRIRVGKYDVEHQTFTFICKDDNKVMVYKRAEDKNGAWRKVDSLLLSREDMENGKIDSTKPLFKFK